MVEGTKTKLSARGCGESQSIAGALVGSRRRELEALHQLHLQLKAAVLQAAHFGLCIVLPLPTRNCDGFGVQRTYWPG
jgi:hypothetical protein